MQNKALKNLKKLLPPFPGIQGKEEYINAAVLALLMSVNDEYHFLLQKRSPAISQGGEICFPGGKFDPRKDTSLRHTALRETHEELGIPAEKISILGQLDTLVVPLGKTIDTFVGTTDFAFTDLTPSFSEVDHAFTIPISFFQEHPPKVYSVLVKNHPSYINDKNETVNLLPVKELGLPAHYQKPWGSFRQRVFVYETNEGIIWGLTARILHDICVKLFPDSVN
ncbi:NUDIX hydrolase [Pectinatus haikarae]|uniref:8-oxo-dGTP pyrophosphatase MutT (NUDIX family) n=1 Tax=Pectinatus haikarae TaxID=349096 RepID=A0ABT9Y3Y8_9FIRM|nr:CoA pyrophosphatase [Pectinatus haikarae]MDQ0202547.1 8-oxo-dGTP pyrophosphatase MutT (NUDIX family) [Pectinatus haikarae]